MKKYVSWVLALFMIVGGVFLMARAQQGPGGPGMGMHARKGMGGGPGFGHGMFFRQLNLTDTQKSQIKALHDQQRTALAPLMKQMVQIRKDMLTATANGNFDQAKITQLANQQAQIQAQLTVAREQLMSKIYNTVLTSEQKAQVDQMRQKQLSRMEQWSQNGGPKD